MAAANAPKNPAQGKDKKSNRPDAPGMKRGSLYASEAAFAEFETAVRQVLDALGEGTPRHVAVSALLSAGADQADTVIRKLAAQHAAALAERLAAIQEHITE